MPSGIDKYLNPAEYALETPIGGYWEYRQSSNIVIGVEYPSGNGYPGAAVLLEIDKLMDDGNLATGSFVFVNAASKWYYWRFGDN